MNKNTNSFWSTARPHKPPVRFPPHQTQSNRLRGLLHAQRPRVYGLFVLPSCDDATSNVLEHLVNSFPCLCGSEE